MFTAYKHFFSVLFLLYLTIGILSLLVHGKQNIPKTTQSPVHHQKTKRVYPKRAIPGYLQNPITKVQPESNFGSTLNFLSETQFDVYVEARKEDCYYYYVMAGSTFYVAAQVLKGGDGSIGLGVKQPNGDVVLPYSWSPVAEYSEEKAQEGYYAVCLDNIFISSGSTLVKLYISRLHSENFETIKDILTVGLVIRKSIICINIICKVVFQRIFLLLTYCS